MAKRETSPGSSTGRESTEASDEEPNFDNESYTVGWICAIKTEYVAAQLILDRPHSRPEYISLTDNNDYTLGQIAGHNVVIAVLPEGEYGTPSAAVVARDMLRSFPNLRIGLMVGIGGGAPSGKHDIRLGDIVVGVPGNGQGGVFQYDFGKAIQGQPFRPTGFLNQAPTVLRTAVSGLQAQYETHGHHLDEEISDILRKNPRLCRKYQRPDPVTDRLYKSDLVHPPDSQLTCEAVCNNQPNSQILRPERSGDEDNPAIHYGRIASANQLMKDALIRDKLAAQYDVLCFEMEAAGLVNHFPCLVIRGICDYSDSHKNKTWQGYAAMAAAVYAKDLLRRMSSKKVQGEKKIVDVLSTVVETVTTITARVERLGLDHQSSKIDRWLRPADSSANLIRAKEACHPGTGLWFLESKPFNDWKSRPRQHLWLNGTAGCGKTVLSSTIIDHLQKDPSLIMLYFFFDFRDVRKQSVTDLIRSLTAQLYAEFPDCRKELEILFDRCSSGHRQPELKALFATFKQMMTHCKDVTIIIDALDECTTRAELLLCMAELSCSDKLNIHLLITSRAEQDIASGLKRWMHRRDFVSIQQDAVNDDIRAYVREQLQNHDEFRKWRSRAYVLERIETELMGKAGGTFRWAACQLDVLKTCSTEPQVHRCLRCLPRTLDETYARTLSQINEIYMEDAIRLLQFLAYAERPLRIEEAVDAILIDPDRYPYFNPDHRMPEPREIARFCPGLVSITTGSVVPEFHSFDNDFDPDSDVASANFEDIPAPDEEYSPQTHQEVMVTELQLAHFSVKEYLISGRVELPNFRVALTEPVARAALTKVCLAYLSSLGQHARDLIYYDIPPRFPFAEYAAFYWTSHARHSESQAHVQERILTFLLKDKPGFHLFTQIRRPDHNVNLEDRTPIFYSSEAGLEQIVRLLLDSRSKSKTVRRYATSVRSYDLARPLYEASAGGHGKVVRVLLDRGADVNAEGVHTALWGASVTGHEKIVRLLLDRGADINGGSYRALIAASEMGQENVVRILLDRGAKIDGKGHHNALAAASIRGQTKVVQILLDWGADIDATKPYSALYAASSEGHYELVQLLLDRGAIMSPDEYSRALENASIRGHKRVVELLQQRGAKGPGKPQGPRRSAQHFYD